MESYTPKPVAPVESMLALSPGAGAILSVVQTGYVNATEQMISLDTNARSPGQNYFKIQAFQAVAQSSTPGGLQDVPLANLDMAGEARGTVNFADMKLSPYFVQNTYGPFGYSMGRTAENDLCMYAWQRIAPDLSPGGGVIRGTINLRALICDRSKTEQQLLDIMYQLRIKGVTGAARLAPSEIGAYGRIIVPQGTSGPANVLDTPTAAPRATPAATTTTKPATTTTKPPAEAPGPVSPPPGSGSTTTAPSGNDGPIVPPPAN